MSNQRLQRRHDVVTRTVGEEAIVYDPHSDRAHALSGPTAAVWRALESTGDLGALPGAAGLDRDLIALTLVELADLSLLEPDATAGLRRRDLVGQAAKVAAAAALVAPIITLALPPAYAAASSAVPLPTGTFELRGTLGNTLNYTVMGGGSGTIVLNSEPTNFALPGFTPTGNGPTAPYLQIGYTNIGEDGFVEITVSLYDTSGTLTYDFVDQSNASDSEGPGTISVSTEISFGALPGDSVGLALSYS